MHMNLFHQNLYKGVFWNDQPHVAYVASTRYVDTFWLYELQVRLVREVFVGNIKLPDKDERVAYVNAWKAREKSMQPLNIFSILDLQYDYVLDLLDYFGTSVEKPDISKFDFEKSDHIMRHHMKSKFNNVLTYRDDNYDSYRRPREREKNRRKFETMA